jgi:hypothetical protein
MRSFMNFVNTFICFGLLFLYYSSQAAPAKKPTHCFNALDYEYQHPHWKRLTEYSDEVMPLDQGETVYTISQLTDSVSDLFFQGDYSVANFNGNIHGPQKMDTLIEKKKKRLLRDKYKLELASARYIQGFNTPALVSAAQRFFDLFTKPNLPRHQSDFLIPHPIDHTRASLYKRLSPIQRDDYFVGRHFTWTGEPKPFEGILVDYKTDIYFLLGLNGDLKLIKNPDIQDSGSQKYLAALAQNKVYNGLYSDRSDQVNLRSIEDLPEIPFKPKTVDLEFEISETLSSKPESNHPQRPPHLARVWLASQITSGGEVKWARSVDLYGYVYRNPKEPEILYLSQLPLNANSKNRNILQVPVVISDKVYTAIEFLEYR